LVLHHSCKRVKSCRQHNPDSELQPDVNSTVTVAGSAAAAPELLRLERQDSRATRHPHGDFQSGYARHRAFYASLRMLPVFRTSQTYELLMAVHIRQAKQ
jgi:hypothetical protein